MNRLICLATLLIILFVQNGVSAQVSALLPLSSADAGSLDHVVSVALQTNTDVLRGSGSISCRYAFADQDPFGKLDIEVRTNSLSKIQDASQRLALLCMKTRCPMVGEWIIQGLHEIAPLSDSDMNDFMQGNGFDATERAQALARRSTIDPESFRSLTCLTGPPSGKLILYSSCFDQPIQCSKP